MRSSKQENPFGNVRGIDFRKFAIHFGPNKIMFIPKDSNGAHYTLHIGVRPGIVDFHETWREPDGTERHKTLFAMRQADLGQLLTPLGHSSAEGLIGIIRKLRIGWMHHRKISVVTGLVQTAQQLGAVAKLGKRKRLLLDEEAFLSNVRAPEFLEEIFDEPDGVFTLVSQKRGKQEQIGYAYKVTLPNGDPRLFWVKKSDLLEVMQQVQDQLIQTARRFAIPPEEYSGYQL